ncbi:FAD-dependent oxidoreductase [Kosakonia sp.]|uniref:flavin monoamine oxidase family protein n=1 Tax=Kosakonia sp. TaxID=1916651 RepID=UPI00289F5186|nr:FAD-dependent oxidoreductase [Kosakonia sp.]
MMPQVTIIGAGLSGLYAACLLEQAGVSYQVLEGRERIGGRILSAGDVQADLGATWLWPAIQPTLFQLLTRLDITLIDQNETGEMLFERTPGAVSRYPGFVSSPAAVRVRGGMSHVIKKLAQHIPATRIVTGVEVTHVEQRNGRIRIEGNGNDHSTSVVESEQVLLALPPMLAANMTFAPSLPLPLLQAWRNTGTWMAPHAKYVACYAEAFWKRNGLSGEARSNVGPMVEMHDVSQPDGTHALFGFIGLPFDARQATGETQLLSLCRAQLVRLFGEEAATPRAEYLKDWAADPFTATRRDLALQAGHTVPPPSPAEGVWRNTITGIASEWSSTFPGYLAGAIEAAEAGVRRIVNQR